MHQILSGQGNDPMSSVTGTITSTEVPALSIEPNCCAVYCIFMQGV